MIGNQLTTDILFGNLNNMVTIWVHRHTDYFKGHEFYKDHSTEFDKMMILEANSAVDVMKMDIKSPLMQEIIKPTTYEVKSYFRV